MGMAHKELEQLELPQRQADPCAVEEDLVGVEVEAKPPALEELVRGRDLLAVGAPHDRTDARHELARAEGLGDVVVGAELEAEHAIHLGRLRGQHDDRKTLRRLGHPEPAADLEAVGAGQHEVEHEEGRALLGDLREGGLAGLRFAHGVTVLLQVEADELPDVLLVLDDEDGAPHGHREILRHQNDRFLTAP